ncbi:NADP-dependent oxidoreductase [Sulfobacillus harzensis]|uniref:NADP-dependent oxidoreductase n=1 Tax=Sulfobacillus harzensis TaxID=2729629 RepID=UPI001FAC0562|nr:NADP-dependent oxidoreductase [Sulfobacillus harzensis]
MLQSRLPLTFPAVLGWDAAGVVEAVGSAVNRFHRGDAVFCRPATHRMGTYAEFVTVDESLVADKPGNLTFLQAASVPLAGLTAWEALVVIAQISPGQRVLIHGGAGGVGSYAIQLAKARDAFVAATGSEANHEYLKSLGADQVVDYRHQAFESVVDPVDVVLDAIGGETQHRSYQVLKRGGTLVSIAQPPDPEESAKHGVAGHWFFLEPDGNKLAQLGALFSQGLMVPQVHVEMPLEDVAEAHRLSEAGHTRGKIGLVVDSQHAYQTH